jgi:hypothetical protein
MNRGRLVLKKASISSGRVGGGVEDGHHCRLEQVPDQPVVTHAGAQHDQQVEKAVEVFAEERFDVGAQGGAAVGQPAQFEQLVHDVRVQEEGVQVPHGGRQRRVEGVHLQLFAGVRQLRQQSRLGLPALQQAENEVELEVRVGPLLGQEVGRQAQAGCQPHHRFDGGEQLLEELGVGQDVGGGEVVVGDGRLDHPLPVVLEADLLNDHHHEHVQPPLSGGAPRLVLALADEGLAGQGLVGVELDGLQGEVAGRRVLTAGGGLAGSVGLPAVVGAHHDHRLKHLGLRQGSRLLEYQPQHVGEVAPVPDQLPHHGGQSGGRLEQLGEVGAGPFPIELREPHFRRPHRKQRFELGVLDGPQIVLKKRLDGFGDVPERLVVRLEELPQGQHEVRRQRLRLALLQGVLQMLLQQGRP